MLSAGELVKLRLSNQRLSSVPAKRPEEVVKWFGAVQAQDYYGAKWALAQRLQNGTDQVVEDSFSKGTILRTHVLRPTWHFVTPADIRWLLALTSPRVHRANAYYYRKLELDDAIIKRGRKTLIAALQGGKQLTRDLLRDAFRRAGLDADGLRLNHLLLHFELDAIICSGPRKGKQFTYALLDERVPLLKALSRDESLAELTWRYFSSHGPAMVQDFVWWSGLTTTDARSGLEMNRHRLMKEVSEGLTYWMPSSKSAKNDLPAARLLPTFDEYIVAYKDRRLLLPDGQVTERNPVFNAAIVIDGRVVGDWKRVLSGDTVTVSLKPFKPLRRSEKRLITDAAHRFGHYLGLKTVVASV